MSLFVLQTKYLSNWWHQSFLKINLHRTARFDLNETDKQTFKKHSGGSRSHYFSEKRAYCSKLLKTHSFTHSVAEPEPVWAGLLLSGTGAGFWRRLRLKKLKNTLNLAKLFSFSTFDGSDGPNYHLPVLRLFMRTIQIKTNILNAKFTNTRSRSRCKPEPTGKGQALLDCSHTCSCTLYTAHREDSIDNSHIQKLNIHLIFYCRKTTYSLIKQIRYIKT